MTDTLDKLGQARLAQWRTCVVSVRTAGRGGVPTPSAGSVFSRPPGKGRGRAPGTDSQSGDEQSHTRLRTTRTATDQHEIASVTVDCSVLQADRADAAPHIGQVRVPCFLTSHSAVIIYMECKEVWSFTASFRSSSAVFAPSRIARASVSVAATPGFTLFIPYVSWKQSHTAAPRLGFIFNECRRLHGAKRVIVALNDFVFRESPTDLHE